MHIVTRPVSPTTSRTRSEVPLRSGMKSISVAAPSSVSNRVSRISVSARYCRLTRKFSGFRRDPPAAVVGAAEQRGKTGIGIEPRPAQPVDRAVARNQRRGFAIADQGIVGDGRRRHRWAARMPASMQPEIDDDLDVVRAGAPAPPASSTAARGARSGARASPGRRWPAPSAAIS